MFTYTTGDLLQSNAKALVNTVNCEGYMGKGIAYQFKLAYPEMNKEYVKICNKHELYPGKLHYYITDDKTIINFPTKNKWREKSKIEYIDKGLDELIILINDLKIPSIAIPPLGSGNGGLVWSNVRTIIENKLLDLSSNIDISIYEPSINYTSKSIVEPQLSLSALILMQIKMHLNKEIFGAITLQKTAYLINLFSHQNYFRFKPGKYGPYDYNIDIISRNIREFQKYHNVSTEEAYNIALNKLISKNIEERINLFMPFIDFFTDYVNKLGSIKLTECIATILYILQISNKPLKKDIIISKFKAWSPDKASRFSIDDIIFCIDYLENTKLILNSLNNYSINNYIM